MLKFVLRSMIGIIAVAVMSVSFAAPSGAQVSAKVPNDPSQVLVNASDTVTLASGTTVTPIVPPAGGGKSASTDFSGDTHWWGYQVKFTTSETRAIAAGAGTCAVIIGKLPALPAKIISGGCGLLGVWAGYVLSSGDCLAVNIYWNGYWNPWKWSC